MFNKLDDLEVDDDLTMRISNSGAKWTLGNLWQIKWLDHNFDMVGSTVEYTRDPNSRVQYSTIKYSTVQYSCRP